MKGLGEAYKSMDFTYKTFEFVSIPKDVGKTLPKEAIIAKTKDEAYKKAKDTLKMRGYSTSEYYISVTG